MAVSAEDFFGDGPVTEVAETISADQFFAEGDVSVQAPETPREKQNFLERVKKDLSDRKQVYDEIIEANNAGEQSFATGVLQVAGKVGAGAVLDFLGEGLVSAGRGLSNITPDFIENPVRDGATAAGMFLLTETEAGKNAVDGLAEGAEGYRKFKEKSPRMARTVESLVNIGLLTAPVKTRTQNSNAGFIGRQGEEVIKRADAKVGRDLASFADDLVRPKQTAKVRTDQVARTAESGLLRQKAVQASPQEAAMAKEVVKVPGVSSGKTLQSNFNAISKEVRSESKVLANELRKERIAISADELGATLDDVSTALAENTLIVGDAAKVSQRVIEQMQRIAKKHPQTAAGLLSARKELDAVIRSQKGGKVFDPVLENAQSIAVREVRQSVNRLIDSKATGVGVKESLRKQSMLLQAMDNIAPKAADEAANVLLRAWKRGLGLLPLRGEFNQAMAAVFGLGGLGASAVFAPAFTKLALGATGLFALRAGLKSPVARRALGQALKGIDRMIRQATDPQLIRELRIDRAAILQIMKEANESER